MAHAASCSQQALSTVSARPAKLTRHKMQPTARTNPKQRRPQRRHAFQDQPAQLDMEDPKASMQERARTPTLHIQSI